MPPDKRVGPTPKGEANSNRFAGEATVPPTDLVSLPPAERRLWWDGYTWGRVHGLEDGYQRGYAACDAEIASLQREAARVVHLVAGIPPHQDAQERRRDAEKAAADRNARNAVPWPEEAAPIPRGTRSWGGGYLLFSGPRPPDPNVPGDKGATGWPLVVVLTPAERAQRAAS
jgi:hypothetical protein